MLAGFFLLTSFAALMGAFFFDGRYWLDAVIFLVLPLVVWVTRNRICSAALALVCLWCLALNLLHPPQGSFLSIRLLWALGLCWGSLILLQRTFGRGKSNPMELRHDLEVEDAGWDRILQKYFQNLPSKLPSLLALPESLLPYERTVIANAILAHLRHAQKLATSSRQKLEAGYTMLSRFVPDEEAAIIYEAESITQEGNPGAVKDFWETSGMRLNEILKGIQQCEEDYSLELSRNLQVHDDIPVEA